MSDIYDEDYEEDEDDFSCDYNIDDVLGLSEEDIPDYLSDEYLDEDAWYGED